MTKLQSLGVHVYICMRYVCVYVGLDKDLDFSECKYWLDPNQVSLLNGILSILYLPESTKNKEKIN